MGGLKNLVLLIAEDEPDLRQATVEYLNLHFDTVIGAPDGEEALRLFNGHGADIVITDIRMPKMDGLTLALKVREASPETPVIICTAFTDVQYLLRAIELGVSSFVRKPSQPGELLAAIERAAVPVIQKIEMNRLREKLNASIENDLGNSPPLREIARQVKHLAATDFSVLLLGETGTGKSRLASLIHRNGPRAAGPLVSVNTAAIPDALFASELFGHEKGAFTGAADRRKGLVDAASGGTLLLDDIDAAPLPAQAALLKLAGEKCYTPVGTSRVVEADIRIICASNCNLETEIEAGRFRRDLYFRIADSVIHIPPLREIPDEIPRLSMQFLVDVCLELGRPVPELTPKALERLVSCSWPGNIRQLKSVIRQAALTSGASIRAGDIRLREGLQAPVLDQDRDAPRPDMPSLPYDLAGVEKWAILRALKAAGNRPMPAARLLGMNYYTLRRHMAKLDIDLPDSPSGGIKEFL